MQRRTFLQTSAAASALTAVGSAEAGFVRGTADHCVMIWLGGGMAQIDTFDPKAQGDPAARKSGSAYAAIPTAVPGVQVCEHLSATAKLMEQVTILRTTHHNVVDEHAAATNRMHTGRAVSGTVQYPSLGSIIAHKRGAADPSVPAYMLIGYPNLTRGPGFLGQKAGFVYLTDLKTGPAGLTRPEVITPKRQLRRETLLNTVRAAGLDRNPDNKLLQQYDAAVAESLRLSGPEFMKTFDLRAESESLRDTYGAGFGQRLLASRRLIERGVRFIEVSHNMNFRNGTGWDTHNQGQQKQHLLIQELDRGLSALMNDLRQKNLLDRTLIVINSEFGRPAQFDSGGGRGHHSKCFSTVLAGGGLKHCGAWGVSDELAMKPVENPTSVPDLFATICSALKIDPSENLYDGDRPVPITDQGIPVSQLLSS